jgi:hypothetical protein
VGSGVLKGQEIIDATISLLTTEDRVRDIAFGLVDLVDVTRAEITTDELRQIADADKRLAQLAPRVVLAVIAPSDLVYGLARMWEMLVEETGWTTVIVRSRAEADAWVKTKLLPPCD